MKIAAIEATTHRVPIQAPLLAEPLTPQCVFVRVTTDTGLTGFGIPAPSSGSPRASSSTATSRPC